MHHYILFAFVFLFQIHLGAQCEEVSLESITNPGPYNVGTLIEGLDPIRNGPDYNGATIYYPENGTPPYAGIAIIPVTSHAPSSHLGCRWSSALSALSLVLLGCVLLALRVIKQLPWGLLQ